MCVKGQVMESRLIVGNINRGAPRVVGEHGAAAQEHAALVAVVQEHIDAVDSGAGCGVCIHRTTFDVERAHVDGVGRRWIARLQRDALPAARGGGVVVSFVAVPAFADPRHIICCASAAGGVSKALSGSSPTATGTAITAS